MMNSVTMSMINATIPAMLTRIQSQMKSRGKNPLEVHLVSDIVDVGGGVGDGGGD